MKSLDFIGKSSQPQSGIESYWNYFFCSIVLYQVLVLGTFGLG